MPEQLISYARDCAEQHLEQACPDAWFRSQTAARHAEGAATALGRPRVEIITAAAWLHAIGESPDLTRSGLAPLDGAHLPARAAEAPEGRPDVLVLDLGRGDLDLDAREAEALRGEAIGDLGPRTRIAVFNNTGVNDDLPFFAVQTQGIPRLSRVLASIIHEVEGAQMKPFERIRVDLEGEICSIPDVGALEQVILDYRRNGGAI